MNPFPPKTEARRPPTEVSPPAPNSRAEEPIGILKKLNELKKDDYILLGIIAVLFFEGCEDYILLAALGYLFIMGIL